MEDDHRQDQLDEMESLEAIYPELFTKVSDEPLSFTLVVVSDESCSPDDPESTSAVTLTVTYTPTYPDEAPQVEIRSSLCVSDEVKKELQQLIDREAEENLGMPMISVVQMSVKEFLDEANEKERERITDRRKREKEEADQKELERLTAGTAVTPEAFKEWAEKFKAEMEKENGKKTQQKSSKGKLTGKQLFLSDTKMQTSDTSLLQEDEVDVDADLFEGLDVDDLPDDIDDA